MSVSLLSNVEGQELVVMAIHRFSRGAKGELIIRDRAPGSRRIAEWRDWGMMSPEDSWSFTEYRGGMRFFIDHQPIIRWFGTGIILVRYKINPLVFFECKFSEKSQPYCILTTDE
jgi:hypothetical protein